MDRNTRNAFVILAATACAVAAMMILAGIEAGRAVAAPPLHRVNPDWQTVVPAGAIRTVPRRFLGSDVQCYSASTGRSYVQRIDRAGPYWTGYHGRAVAGFDRANHDFVNWSSYPVICASWKG